jgi:hypothetical protein
VRPVANDVEVGAGVLLDELDRLAADVTCRRCGYNLRGLGRDQACPECGTGIAWSIRGDLLRFADPPWLRRVARGVLLLEVTLGALFGVTMLTWSGSAGAWAAVPAPIVFLGGPAATAIGLVGAWLATTPERGLFGEPLAGIRRLARGLCLVLLPAGPGTGVIGWFFGRMPRMWVVLVGVVVLACVVAVFAYLRGLARRIPDAGLERRTSRLIRGVAVSGGVLAVASAGLGVVNSLRGASAIQLGWLTLVPGIEFVWTTSLLILIVLSLGLVDRYRRELAAAAWQAGLTWITRAEPPSLPRAGS